MRISEAWPIFGFHQTWILGLIFISSQVIRTGATVNVIESSQKEQDYNNYYNDGNEPNYKNRRSAQDASIIPKNYSIYELPPTPNGGTVNVKLSVVIMNVRDIKEIGEEISIEMNLRIYWKDPRLSHIVEHLAKFPSTSPDAEFVLLQPSLLNHLWHPDLYIDHVKKIDQPSIISLPASLRMYPDNTLRYSARITITLSCPMDFHSYPADTQKCDCDFKSYAYSDKKMILAWRDENGASFAQDMVLSNFFVGLDNPNSFSVQSQSGSWSGIRFTVLLTRKLSYHIIQTYLPSIVLVIVSWLSFLVNSDSVPGRMTVLMTCLLTLISMFAAVRHSTPNVSYVKSVDTWMFVCVFFVFLALMEFTLVLKIKSVKFKPKPEKPGNADQQHQGAGINHFGSVRSQRGANTHFQNALPIRRVPSLRGQQPQHIEEEETEMQYIPSRRASTEYMEYPGSNSRRSSIGPPPGEPIYSRPPSHYHTLQQFIPIPPSLRSFEPISVSTNEKIVAKVELTASIIIPILFLIFNLLYWPFLIVSSDYYTEKTGAKVF